MKERYVIDLEKYLMEDEECTTTKKNNVVNIKYLIDKTKTFEDVCKDIAIGAKVERINAALEYLETLHEGETGTIFLAQKINGEFRQKAFRYKAIYSALMQGTSYGDVGISGYGIDFNKDTYMSVNSFYKGRRLTDDIKTIKAIQLEFDNHDEGFRMTDTIFNNVISLLEMDYLGTKVPYPTLIIKTGRGMQLIWKLDNCKNKKLQQKVALTMFNELKEFDLFGLEMDAKVLDLARIFRVPGTMHTITKTITEIYSNTREIFDLEDIVYGYYPELADEEKNKNREKRSYIINRKRQVKYSNKHWNYYVLNSRRVEDLEKLFKLRCGNFKNCRNYFMHLYCYHLSLITRNEEYIISKAVELDNRFSIQCGGTLGKKHINNIISSVFKKAEKLLDAKDKKNYDLKDVYRYTNITIIEVLKITIEEQKQMSTIRSKEIYAEIHRKNCLDNYYKKRNEKIQSGEISTKANKIQHEAYTARELKKQGYKNKDIAQALNISLSTVKRRLAN